MRAARRPITAVALGVVAAGVMAAPAVAAPIVKYRVNAGGPVLAAPDGVPWEVDSTATPSPYVNAAADNKIFQTTAPIDLSDPTIPVGTPMEVFQTERWDTNKLPVLRWSFPVEPGKDYLVRLYFGETWDGAFAVGARIFSVFLEGQRVLNEYDQFAETGANAGTVKAFFVPAAQITDGVIDIELPQVVQNPAVKGVEVLEVPAGEDAVPPTTAIESGPNGATNVAEPQFAFASSEPNSSFACRVDATPWAACVSGQALAGLAEGAHTLRVRAIDSAGNVDPLGAVRQFSIDSTAPALTGLRVSPKRMRAAKRGKTISTKLKGKTGSVVTFRLSEAGKAKLTVQRKSGRRWRNVRGSGTVKVAEAGRKRVRFTGRLKGRTLKAGQYRLRLVGSDAAGNKAAKRTARFSVR